MRLFKFLVQKILARQVRRFFRVNHGVKLVVVVGSIGKTGTKSALEQLLGQKFRVRASRGNLNSALSAPLEILRVDGPNNPRSPLNWLRVLAAARKAARRKVDAEIIVQECGTDHPGEIPQFAEYLRPDAVIITAITPEHMEFFADLDAVAAEETALTPVSRVAIFNQDDIAPAYQQLIKSAKKISYGSDDSAAVRIEIGEFKFGEGFFCRLRIDDQVSDEVLIPVLGAHQLRVLAGASAVAAELGMTMDEIIAGLAKITPVEGRMQLLVGRGDATLIDDSYNSSPAAAIMALETLYSLPHTRKIAVLGGMNELGEETANAHQEVVEFCDADQLELVVTVGELAKEYFLPQLRAKGVACQHADTALAAAKILGSYLGQDTAILFKGSQGGIFLEEAIKPLLKNPADQAKLVRQSDGWLKTKEKFFTEFS